MKHIYPIILLFVLVLFTANSFSQILINEVCSKNNTLIKDLKGNYPDWIELYNPSDVAVSLNGYHLSDETGLLNKWQFGDVEIPAKSYLIVFASERDISYTPSEPDTVSAMSTEYGSWTDSQHSKNPGESTISNNEFDEILGYADDKPIYSAKYYVGDNYGPGELGWYATFLKIYMDEDKTVHDMSRFDELIVKATISKDREIDVRFEQKGLEDWLGYSYRIKGTGEEEEYSISLDDEFAIENITELYSIKYEGKFPEGYTELRLTDQLWVDLPGFLHSNFKISSKGETLTLSDPDLNIIDQITVPELEADRSYGRVADGDNEFGIFTTPSPTATNNTNHAYNGYCTKTITFDKDANFYSGKQEITISGADEIHYTTDGSAPTIESKLAEGAISLTKTTVLKVACFDNNSYPEQIFTNTYFIDEPTTLPVFSISTEPDNFFDYETGIYEDGPNWTEDMPHKGANYWEEWERPVYVEFFDKEGNLAFKQGAITEIFGGWSRTNAMKSLKLKAEEDLGGKTFDYKFFEHKTNDKFKMIVLRNSGNDFNQLHFQDAINHESARTSCNIDLQGFQPSIVFINGEYWGIHNIREKINDHYIEDNHGTKADTVELFEAWGQPIKDAEYDVWGLFNSITSKSMTNQNNFDNAMKHFDKESFIDFFAVNTIISNWDWPQNNLKFWYSPNTKKIRYIMYDTDISLGLFNIQDYDFNQIARLIEADEIGPHAEILSKFLTNTSFKEEFINRNADLMNTAFSAEGLKYTIDSIKDIMDPEMGKHRERWGGDMHEWEDKVDNVKEWIDNRIPYAFDQLEEVFELNKQIDITLKVLPEGSGSIKINSISPSLPWTGTYFDGVPVTISAIPAPGYTFEKWDATSIAGIENLQSFTQNIDKDITVTAHFTGSKTDIELIVSEINYNSADDAETGDWFEIYNAGESTLNLTGWKIRDENDYNFYSFPDNFEIKAGEYIVFSSSTADFNAFFPNTETVAIPFKLDNSGDNIRLYDAKGNEYLNVRYNDKGEWPATADAGGYTLEFQSYGDDPNQGTNWFAGCFQGSPGRGYDKTCSPVDTEEISVADITITPQPARNEIIINTDSEEFDITLYTASGNEILNVPSLASGESIDISHLNSGIYFINIRGDFGSITKEIIKK